MSWRNQLRPASFRGVSFEVTATSGRFGRRTQAHEFPKRDTSATEDLGRTRRSFSVQAFVIGDDWIAQRDALIRACEAPGAGVLIHPTYGRMLAVCEGCEPSEDTAGRFVAFRLDFAEEGQLAFPTGTVATAGALEDAAGLLLTAAKADFLDRFDASLGFIADALDFADELLDGVTDAITRPLATLAAVGDVVAAVDALQDDLADLLDTPEDFADGLIAIFDEIDDRTACAEIAGDSGTFTAPPSSGSESETDTATNLEAIQRLVWRSALAGAARAASVETFGALDDATAVRDALADRLALEAEQASGDAYDALSELRIRLVEDITLRSAGLARVVDYEVLAEASTLELAFELYEDASRTAEIEERNGVIHPGFVAGTLRVLTA